MTPLEAAHLYAARGWRVIPIPRGEKYPAGIPDWQTRATTDPDQIDTWWTDTDHGIGIATGAATGMFVIDIDPRHGGDDTLADLEHEHGPLPDTLEVLTGGGGRHLYYKIPDGVEIRNDAGGRLGPGLDVRGEGGQVVAPPTLHPTTGHPYAWEITSDPADGVTAMLPPAWLVELLAAELAPARPRREAAPSTVHAASERPGDRWAAETSWPDLLEPDGWRIHSARNGRTGSYELWTRPGKDPREGASASLYYQGSDVLKIFTSSVPGLDAGCTYTKFGYLAAIHHAGDQTAAARHLAQRYRTDDSSTSIEVGKPETPQRPSIVHNGRQLDDVVAHATAAVVAHNHPTRLFVRAGALARVRPDEDQRPIVETLRAEHVRLELADAATWWRANKDGEHTATSPPLDVAISVLATGTWAVPGLAGVVEAPVLRPDGTFHTDHGYDPATRLYHWHHSEPYAPILATPTADQIAVAVALVDDALCDFPWDTSADRANAWALLLTPLLRPIIGQVPMALVDAPEPGTGKGLLVTLASILALGRPAGLATWPAHEEELGKVITSMLMAGQTMIIFDNVEGAIRSGKLAAALTADIWQDRILGRSETTIVPNRATWVATGNNIDVGGDLARRCYRIRLDARQARPWKRTGFRHPDLIGWATEHRGELLGALCTIIRSWVVAGRPKANTISAMGGYTSWVRTVGGVLEHAGVNDFLANLDDFHTTADREALAWEAFLNVWSEQYGEQALTVGELVTRMRDSQWGATLRDALPDDLAGHIDSNGFTKRLGRALRQRTGRHYGDDGIHLVEMPRDRRQVAIYVVTTRSIQLPGLSETTEGGGGSRDVVDHGEKPARHNTVTRDDLTTAGFAGFSSPPESSKTYPQGSTESQGRPAEINPRNPQTRAAELTDEELF